MCPECGQPLITFELEGVQIDRCVACGGTWLDRGELAMLMAAAGQPSGKGAEALDRAKAGARGKRRCPRCRRRLHLISIGGENPVQLDRCPHAHGIWFDRGEVLKTVEYFEKQNEGEEGAVARFFAGLFQYEIQSKPKEGE